MSHIDLRSADVEHSGPVAWSPIFPATISRSAPAKRCSLCSNILIGYFFRARGQSICEHCADQMRQGLSTAGRGSLLGASILGVAAAAAAMAINASILGGSRSFGPYFAIFVGWMVGRAVIAGARGVGGFRIQLIAAALTYLAITLDAIPLLVYRIYKYPGAIPSWSGLLNEILLPGVTAPFVRFNAGSITSIAGFAALVAALLIAVRLTRAKPTVVAGPFDVNFP